MPIDVVTSTELLSTIDDAITLREPTVFVGLYASLFRNISRDAGYAALVGRSVTYPDGYGVVTELQQRGVEDAERVATTDAVHPIARLAAQHQWRVGLIGAAPGVAPRAAAALAISAPGVEIVKTWDGYGGLPDATELACYQLDMVFVALGAGQQEKWAHDVATRSGVPAVLTCGGLFDFLAGDRRRAPRWLQRAGLEWAFRVALEPRRLFGRYVLGNSYFLRHARADRAAAAPDLRAVSWAVAAQFDTGRAA